VELVGTREELGDIQGSLASRRAGGFGTDAREESGRRRPDARTFAVFGRKNSLEQRHGWMMFAVSLSEFVQ
jgi:hypothetical protein